MSLEGKHACGLKSATNKCRIRKYGLEQQF